MPAQPAIEPLPVIEAQRARGRLGLTFQLAAERTRIATFYQEGCLKARLPRPVEPDVCEAVTMNISGGIAGGDALSVAIGLDAHTRACIAGQAAERVYRALAAEPISTACAKVCGSASCQPCAIRGAPNRKPPTRSIPPMPGPIGGRIRAMPSFAFCALCNAPLAVRVIPSAWADFT